MPLSNGSVISSGVLEERIVYAYVVTRWAILLSIDGTEGFFYDTNFQILVDDNKCWHN